MEKKPTNTHKQVSLLHYFSEETGRLKEKKTPKNKTQALSTEELSRGIHVH